MSGFFRNSGAWGHQPLFFMLGMTLVMALFGFTACSKNENTVTVYTSQDQVYAEEIFKAFTTETGIRVRAVYDSEAVKTVGLANRLLAEKNHPQCDVFWSNEELRTRMLARQNVFRETNGWAAFGYRSRRVVINNASRLHGAEPLLFASLTNKVFAGQFALAYPLFGTTATHFLALRQHWGTANWESWCRALAENKPKLVDGNSVVVRFVGQGEVQIGFTDSDDIFNGKREGLNVGELPLSPDALLIPNTVAVIRGNAHEANAEKLFQFLQSKETISKLITVGALEGESASSVASSTLPVDWDQLISELEAGTKALQDIFVR